MLYASAQLHLRWHYRINGGPERTAPTAEAPDGETFGGKNAYDTYYHYLRGAVTGARVGDSVEVWFESRREESERFSYRVADYLLGAP